MIPAAENGALPPIEVRLVGEGVYELAGGRHRLEAHRAAGIPLIAAVVVQDARRYDPNAYVIITWNDRNAA